MVAPEARTSPMPGATRDVGRDPGLSSSVDDSRFRGLASKRGFGEDSPCFMRYKDICSHHLASLLEDMTYDSDRLDPCCTSNILIVSCMTGSGRANF
ncbi:hypothetical protein FOXYSP1_07628 [Fusarium oxysporum f. sp. phaseoli]